MFTKRQIQVRILNFFGKGKIKEISQKDGGAYGYAPIRLEAGHHILADANAKRTHIQVIAGAGNEAINQGVNAVNSTLLLATRTLTTTQQIFESGSFGGNLDCGRCVQVVAAKTGATPVGNGGFTAANSRVVTVGGINMQGVQDYEDIPLNDTTAVVGKKPFRTINYVALPARVNTDGGDTVSVGSSKVLGLEFPVEAATDILENARKAAAATSYTIEALLTYDIGQASSNFNLAQHPPQPDGTIISAEATTLNLASGSGAAWPNGAQRTHAEIIHPDGTIEQIIVTNRSVDALTVVRGRNMTTARKVPAGALIAMRRGMTVEPATLNAEDRFLITYRTRLVG